MNEHSLFLYRCRSFQEIRKAIQKVFVNYESVLPTSKNAHILIKPNLNSYMNALTGNTTDLRVIVAVIQALQERGYHKLTIGEGTSSGFFRNRISVANRLRIDKVCQNYGVDYVDFNNSPGKDIKFASGMNATVAKLSIDADFFINLPKFKMHFEAGMSVALKNLVGCLVGVDEKQKVHRSLDRNILNLNRSIVPNLHIVDGLIAMEGTGPSRGTPIQLDLIMAGQNPYLVDLACARISQVPYKKIPALELAEIDELIDPGFHAYLDRLHLDEFAKPMKRPEVSRLVALVNDPRWQYNIIRIRLAPGIRKIFEWDLVGKFLNATGLRQDIFTMEDLIVDRLIVDRERCIGNCESCQPFCPADLKFPDEIGDNEAGCLECMYCYLVCPNKAVNLDGQLGFLTEQIRQYDGVVRQLAFNIHNNMLDGYELEKKIII